jgi:putative oxygen-independent coproporphyrinogen III oxidase
MANPGLYVHFPWCVQKCPYCDFNSHTYKNQSYGPYVKKLIADLNHLITEYGKPQFSTVFFGGGTPSLCPPSHIHTFIDFLKKNQLITSSAEITLEANPGTTDLNHLKGFRDAGVNRLSIGIQSFNHDSLQKLGRIHDSKQAIMTYEHARKIEFSSINIDLMFGLNQQSLNMAMDDIKTALQLAPDHLSYYELTIEPNTLFYHQRPSLPDDDTLYAIEKSAHELINAHYSQYEISAFSLAGHQCQHNLNYWRFGDYWGIGAGACGKITTSRGIIRQSSHKHPKTYQSMPSSDTFKQNIVTPEDECFEFALNRWRLNEPIHKNELNQLSSTAKFFFEKLSKKALTDGLIINKNQCYKKTSHGIKYHNQLVTCYLLSKND